MAVITALATGLGVAPLVFIKRTDNRWRGIAAATASGMMLSASVFALADKALRRGDALDVIGGMLSGAAFFAWTARLVARTESRQAILLVVTLFVHSIPEGAAIGVGYAPPEKRGSGGCWRWRLRFTTFPKGRPLRCRFALAARA